MSDTNKRSKLTIANQTYTIIGTENKKHMEIVEQLANQQLSEITKMSPELDGEESAILLAINALSDQVKKADEILRLTDELAEKSELAKRAEELGKRLERFEMLEAQARQTLQQNGELPGELSPSKTQQIINQQAKAKIAKNQQEKE